MCVCACVRVRTRMHATKSPFLYELIAHLFAVALFWSFPFLISSLQVWAEHVPTDNK